VPKETTKILNQAQQLGVQAAVGALRSLRTEIAEAEAGIVPMQNRWEHQQVRFRIKCHTAGETFMLGFAATAGYAEQTLSTAITAGRRQTRKDGFFRTRND
jgi:hypothetical protein